MLINEVEVGKWYYYNYPLYYREQLCSNQHTLLCKCVANDGTKVVLWSRVQGYLTVEVDRLVEQPKRHYWLRRWKN